MDLKNHYGEIFFKLAFSEAEKIEIPDAMVVKSNPQPRGFICFEKILPYEVTRAREILAEVVLPMYQSPAYGYKSVYRDNVKENRNSMFLSIEKVSCKIRSFDPLVAYSDLFFLLSELEIFRAETFIAIRMISSGDEEALEGEPESILKDVAREVFKDASDAAFAKPTIMIRPLCINESMYNITEYFRKTYRKFFPPKHWEEVSTVLYNCLRSYEYLEDSRGRQAMLVKGEWKVCFNENGEETEDQAFDTSTARLVRYPSDVMFFCRNGAEASIERLSIYAKYGEQIRDHQYKRALQVRVAILQQNLFFA